MSLHLNPAERNYDVGNRELLAVKMALEEWRHWLEGAEHPFLVWTDHKNLEYLCSAMAPDVSAFITACMVCAQSKTPRQALSVLLQPPPVPHSPGPIFPWILSRGFPRQMVTPFWQWWIGFPKPPISSLSQVTFSQGDGPAHGVARLPNPWTPGRHDLRSRSSVFVTILEGVLHPYRVFTFECSTRYQPPLFPEQEVVRVPGKELRRLFSRPPPDIVDKRTATGLWLHAIGSVRGYGCPHGTCPSRWNPANFSPVSLVLSPFLESLVPLLFAWCYSVPSVHATFHVPKIKPLSHSPLSSVSRPIHPPCVIDGQPGYTVRCLLRVRPRCRGFQYLVDWERCWVPTKDILEPALNFHRWHPGQPGMRPGRIPGASLEGGYCHALMCFTCFCDCLHPPQVWPVFLISPWTLIPVSCLSVDSSSCIVKSTSVVFPCSCFSFSLFLLVLSVLTLACLYCEPACLTILYALSWACLPPCTCTLTLSWSFACPRPFSCLPLGY
jgi:hypothetical protein